ncbi:MAG: hypothetical protein RL127_1242 [Bacteroidota bacterium]
MEILEGGIQVLISFFSIVIHKLIYPHEKTDINLCLYGIGFDGIWARFKHAFKAREEGRV